MIKVTLEIENEKYTFECDNIDRIKNFMDYIYEEHKIEIKQNEMVDKVKSELQHY